VADVDLSPPAGASLDNVRFAVIDVETSGLDPRRHRVLQIAVVLVDRHGRVHDRWASYVRPRWGRLSRLGPVHIHGIAHRDLRGAPRPTEVIDEVARRIDGAILTAHNLEFDRAFLDAAAGRARRALPAVRQLCTLQMSRRLDPEREMRHRLIDICTRHGIDLTRPHDALADADATALIIPHLLAAHGVETLDQLLEFTS
jgi:DNA polymerase III subunit epsilon